MIQLARQSSLDEVPEWLNPAPPVPALIPDPAKARRDLTLVQYPIIFERTIERIRAGEFMEIFIKDDLREFELESFENWIKRDRDRKTRLKEAIEARSHIIIAGTFVTAEGRDTMEDTARSKLRVDNAWRKAVADNRKYYGDTTKIEMNSTVEVRKSREESIKELMRLQETVVGSGVYVPKSKDDVSDV